MTSKYFVIDGKETPSPLKQQQLKELKAFFCAEIDQCILRELET